MFATFPRISSWSWLVLAMCVEGCDARSTSTPADGGAAAVRGEAGAARDDTNGTIAHEDCARWSTHGVDVTIRDWEAAGEACSPAMRADLANKLEGQRATILRAAGGVCEKHVGEPYLASDARCYTTAPTVKALRACGFFPMTNPGDSDLVAELENLRRTCAAQAATSATASASAARPR
jgi:hypothetical protein